MVRSVISRTGPVTLPPGTSAFCARQGVAHRGDGDLVGRQPVRVDPHVDRPLETAARLDLAHARRRARSAP